MKFFSKFSPVELKKVFTEDKNRQPYPKAVAAGLVCAAVLAVFVVVSFFLRASLLGGSSNSVGMLILAHLGMLGISALLAQRRTAVEIFAWLPLLDLVIGGNLQIDSPLSPGGRTISVELLHPFGFFAALYVALFIFLIRNRIFHERPKMKGWREIAAATRMTFAVILILEIAAGLIVHARFHQLVEVREPPVLADDYDYSKPVIITLGSSPAFAVQSNTDSFSDVLSKKLGDRFTFINLAQGGSYSHMLVRIADEQLKGKNPPSALIVYSGHQDYVMSEYKYFFREMDLISPDSRTADAIQWLIRNSKLVRLALYFTTYAQMSGPTGSDWETQCLRVYQQNIERIALEAKRKNVTLFVVTLIVDTKNIPDSRNNYTNRLNDWLRELPKKYPNVVVADANAEFNEIYPQGRLDSCEPFWLFPSPNPSDGPCGDPVHLDTKGHQLIAEVIREQILVWVAETANPILKH